MKRLPAKALLDDSNYPSVILWSLFNEEGLQGQEEGMEMERAVNVIVAIGSGRPINDAALTALTATTEWVVVRNQARLRLPRP